VAAEWCLALRCVRLSFASAAGGVMADAAVAAPEVSETDRLMYEHMTPFDAEVLLVQYPHLAHEKPQLVYLRDKRDYYLTECSGLFVEGAKAVATEDTRKLKMLAQFAPRSETEKTQWQSVVEMAYKQGLSKPSTTLLAWLNDYEVLFNIASLAEDVLRSPHQSVHVWFAKQTKKRNKKLKAAQPLAIEAAPAKDEES
jgi:hypothetical protein